MEKKQKFLNKSPILFEQKVNGRLLVFNPAVYGKGPIILTSLEEEIFNLFKDGAEVGRIKKILPGQKDFDSALILLTERKILVEKNDLSLPEWKNWDIPNERRTVKAHLLVTDKCNMQKTCFNGKCYVKRGESSMSLETAKKAVDKIIAEALEKGFGKILFFFFGGEPLLEFPLIKRIMEYVKANYQDIFEKGKIRFKIVTNTLLLDEKKIDFLASFGTDFGLSAGQLLDTPETSQRFFAAIKAVHQKLQQYRKGAYSVWLVLSPQNLADLPKITQKIILSGGRLRFSLMKFASHQKAFNSEELKRYNEEAIKQLNACFDLLEAGLWAGNRIGCRETSAKRLSGLNYLLESMVLHWPKTQVCGLGKSLFIIDTQGRVCLCPLTLSHPLGMVEQGPLDLVKSQPFIIKDFSQVAGCADCLFRYNCAGACQLTTLQTFGRIGPSPYCEVYKEIIPRWISLEGLFSARSDIF